LILPVNAAHPHSRAVVHRTAINDRTTVNDRATIHDTATVDGSTINDSTTDDSTATVVLSVGCVGRRKIRIVWIDGLKHWVDCGLSRLGLVCGKGGNSGQTQE
jgi:hypothetical protein